MNATKEQLNRTRAKKVGFIGTREQLMATEGLIKSILTQKYNSLAYTDKELSKKDGAISKRDAEIMRRDTIMARKLGEILIENGIINEVQLKNALLIQKGRDVHLGQILIEMKLATEGQIIEALSQQ